MADETKKEVKAKTATKTTTAKTTSAKTATARTKTAADKPATEKTSTARTRTTKTTAEKSATAKSSSASKTSGAKSTASTKQPAEKTKTSKPSGKLTTDEELRELAHSRAKKKAEERLKQVDSGDLTRGLASKGRKLEDTPTFKEVKETTKEKKEKAKPEPKQKTKEKVVETDVKVKQPKKKNVGNSITDEPDIIIAATDTKARRKGLIIATISVLLVVVWIFIIITRFITPQEPKYNCGMKLMGNAHSECNLTLNGKKAEKWIIPEGVGPRAKYENIGIELNLNSGKVYDVRFRIEVKNGDRLVERFGIVDAEDSFVEMVDSNNLTWYVSEDLAGGVKINLIDLITFYDLNTAPALRGISSDNIQMSITVVVDYAS